MLPSCAASLSDDPAAAQSTQQASGSCMWIACMRTKRNVTVPQACQAIAQPRLHEWTRQEEASASTSSGPEEEPLNIRGDSAQVQAACMHAGMQLEA